MNQRSTPAGIFADPRDGIMIRFENNRVRKITEDERRLVVAALRPAASGDLRERIARIVDPEAYEPISEARWEGLARLESQAEAQLRAERKADLILTSLPGRDEEAIRAELDTLNATLARVARVDNSLAKQLSESIATNAGLTSERDTLRARLKEAQDALLTAARRFELMAAGGVECTNGACPKTGHSEALRAARAFRN